GLLKLLFTVAMEKKMGHRVDISGEADTVWFQDFLKSAPATPQPVDVQPEDLAVLMYTGGTTGVSKGAMLTHKNIMANAVQVSTWLTDAKEGQESFLTALPLFHSFAMTCCMNAAIYLASSMVLIPNPRELHHVLESIVKHRPTLYPGVPTMYVAINNFPGIENYDLRSIRACVSGAAGLPVEVQQRFMEITGARLIEGYGLSEASPVVTANPIYGQNKIGSIGIPWPDTEVKIMDLATGETEVPQGEIGELACRGPQVMQGYWNMSDETAMVLRTDAQGQTWLYTGDIASMDEDGYFQIVDRKKDMIIAGGFNVYPRDIEEVLYEYPKVKEVVAAGVPDAYRGETVKVYVVLKDGETATEEEIIDFCKGKLAKFKVPRQVEFRSELPKTMVGKILRRVLVEEERQKLAEQGQ
ncbi:MAG: long-chain fatty acid--CoA ligase, partial [Chloroflexi bacterium]|nr:long-chain fatty acid--CoA ligase [Chloroflexota bacterium]